ncbi:MAG: hypothetical protein FWE36_07950 [Erysipelotrichales bacterium]|nr:hypothetical protein [Erysipelotrichales bacterium]
MKKLKIVVACIICLLLLGACSLSNANIIMTADQLSTLSNSNSRYRLGADIDLSEFTNWTPINGFTGTFDGNGHTISNLQIDTLSVIGTGLFGEINGGAVINLNFANVQINAGFAGAVAGKSTNTRLENINVLSGTIGRNLSRNIGGIVGERMGGISNNLTNYADVFGTEYVGGLFGFAGIPVSSDNAFQNYFNNGNITGGNNVGGIAGSIQSRVVGRIYNLTNTGTITGNSNVGGIAGYSYGVQQDFTSRQSTFLNLVNTGIILGNGDNIGGIFGEVKNGRRFHGVGGDGWRNHSIVLLNAENNADVTGRHFVGGIIGNGGGVLPTNLEGFLNENTITGVSNVGGIAGIAGSITGCENRGRVIATGANSLGFANLGGIAGEATNITNSQNIAEINHSSEGDNIGGVVGLLTGGNPSGLFNTGNINAPNSNNVGGIVGRIDWDSSERSFQSSENSGNIISFGNVGGLVGKITVSSPIVVNNRTTVLSNLTNSGFIYGTGLNVGGVVGMAQGSQAAATRWHAISFIHNNNSGNITGSNWVGGIVGRIADPVNRVIRNEENNSIGIKTSTNGENKHVLFPLI